MARPFRTLAAAAIAAIVAVPLAARDGQERPAGQGFSFRTGVELVSVTVTVTDDRGRFVPDLKISDFVVYEEGQPQSISQFDSERVPVSLGVALDTSGSMIGEKMTAAQATRSIVFCSLLGAQDQVFLYRFDSRPTLVRGWSEDRRAIAERWARCGRTAAGDLRAVAEAVRSQSGTRRKKALVISDGNDTSSRTNLADTRQRIRRAKC